MNQTLMWGSLGTPLVKQVTERDWDLPGGIQLAFFKLQLGREVSLVTLLLGQIFTPLCP